MIHIRFSKTNAEQPDWDKSIIFDKRADFLRIRQKYLNYMAKGHSEPEIASFLKLRSVKDMKEVLDAAYTFLWTTPPDAKGPFIQPIESTK